MCAYLRLTYDATIPAFKSRCRTCDSSIIAVLCYNILSTSLREGGTRATGRWWSSTAGKCGTGTYPLGHCWSLENWKQEHRHHSKAISKAYRVSLQHSEEFTWYNHKHISLLENWYTDLLFYFLINCIIFLLFSYRTCEKCIISAITKSKLSIRWNQ